jgi:fimbrial chaperone protein
MVSAVSFGTGLASASGNASVNVRPLRVDLSNEQRSSAITVDNGQAAPEIMRVEVDAWDQRSGSDRYVRSTDLLVVPPVLSIAPQHGKVVRLALRSLVSGSREQAYRVFVTEVPPQIKQAQGAQVQVAYRIGIPVFVNAGKVSASAPVNGGAQWKARLIDSKRIRISVASASDTHIRINETKIYADASKEELLADQPVSEYLLAGATRSFDIAASKPLELPTIVVEGAGAAGPFSVVVPVAKY